MHKVLCQTVKRKFEILLRHPYKKSAFWYAFHIAFYHVSTCCQIIGECKNRLLDGPHILTFKYQQKKTHCNFIPITIYIYKVLAFITTKNSLTIDYISHSTNQILSYQKLQPNEFIYYLLWVYIPIK